MIIACRMARSPVTAWGMVVACRRARRRITSRMARHPIVYRHVHARFSDFCIPAVPTVGHPTGPSSAMSRPNMALEPTPPPAVYEHLFFSMAVAFYRGAFGGAAQRHRWAACQKLSRIQSRSIVLPVVPTEARHDFLQKSEHSCIISKGLLYGVLKVRLYTLHGLILDVFEGLKPPGE